MRPPIHSRKHYVQKSLSTISAGALLTEDLVKAVPTADVDTAPEVADGAIVKAIYIELWIRASVAEGAYVFIVEKLPGIGSAITTTNMAALNNYENKKNVLFASQGLSNDDNTVATPILRQWIKIPKGKQRMGLDDRIRWTCFAQSLDHDVCGLAVYKEYT